MSKTQYLGQQLLTVGAVVDGAVPLTDASSVAVNAQLGNYFRLTMTSGVGASRTIAAPSNPVDTQLILFELIQDSTGSQTVTWTSGAGGYEWGTDVPVPTLTTTASKADYVGFVYNATANIWRGIAVARGYT
jgi:hypothetical protein